MCRITKILTIFSICLSPSMTILAAEEGEKPNLEESTVAPYLLPEGLRNFIIEKNDLVGECARDQIEEALVEPLDKVVGDVVSLRQSVCIYHAKSQKPSSDSDSNPPEFVKNQRAINEQGIKLVSVAQQKGLPPIHQTYASLLEGIYHCRQAKLERSMYQQLKDEDNNGPLIWNNRFCASRRKASAAFTAVNWNLAFFDIRNSWHNNPDAGVAEPSVTPNNFSVTKVIAEYAGCYDKDAPLHSDFDSDCIMLSGLDNKQISSVAQAAVKKVVGQYMGENAKNKITAMLSRKKQRVDGVVSESDDRIKNLEKDAGVVLSRYNLFNTAYDTHSATANDIVRDYRESASKILAVKNAADRWVKGLESAVQTQLTNGAKAANDLDSSGMKNRATNLVDDLKKIEQKEATQDKNVRNLCRVYYCQLKSRAFKIPGDFKSLCSISKYKDNVLCSNNPKWTVGNQTKDLKSICNAVGFKHYAKFRLPSLTARKCLGGMEP